MTVLCEYRRAKMPEKEKVSTDANIDVAMSLRAGLLALGFDDADIARGNTTLTKVISQTVRTELELNQQVYQRYTSNKQLRSDQTVLGSSDQYSIITASENSAVFNLEDPSVLVRTSKKRKRKNLEENSRPTTSNIESSTETSGKLLRGPFSPLVANAIIAESCQTPVLITDSVVADNDSSFSPRPSGQDRPEYSHSTILPCSKPTEVIYSSATGLIGGGRERSTLAESTRQFLPPCKYVCTYSSFITLTYY